MGATTQPANYTMTPNALFDKLLPVMGFAELKVVLHAIRKTLGFHRESDTISLSQFVKATGLSRQSVIDGLAAAVVHGIIAECGTDKHGARSYRLTLEVDQSSNLTSSGQVSRPVNQADQSSNLTSSGQVSRPPVEGKAGQASRLTKERKKDSKEKESSSSFLTPPAPEIQPAQESPERPAIFKLLEDLTGTINSLLVDDVKDATAEFPADWIEDAFKEAAASNGRSWKYVRKILERWKQEGKGSRSRTAAPSPTPPPPAADKPSSYNYDPRMVALQEKMAQTHREREAAKWAAPPPPTPVAERKPAVWTPEWGSWRDLKRQIVEADTAGTAITEAEVSS